MNIYHEIHDRIRYSWPDREIFWKKDPSVNCYTGVLFVDINMAGFSARLLLDTTKDYVIIKDVTIVLNTPMEYSKKTIEHYLTDAFIEF